jgi:SpoVK/Ycf46/Vps4 family AAA+-type ATPase
VAERVEIAGADTFLDGTEQHLDALLGALRRLDLLLEQAVALTHAAHGSGAEGDPYRSLYISPEEVARLLDRAPGASTLQSEDGLSERRIAADDIPRLNRLARAFGLTPFDLDLILIALAPELDLRYERLYAYLQDDMTRRRPSVDLALNLLCTSLEHKLAARPRLGVRAPLLEHQFLRLVDDPADQQPSLLNRYLKVDERIVNYLLGADDLDVRLMPYARHGVPETRLDELLLPADLKHRLALLVRAHAEGGAGLIYYFQGPYGVGKQTTAQALCGELGIGLLTVDGERLSQVEDAAFETIVRLAGRETILQGAALYWDSFDVLLPDDKRSRRETLLRALGDRRGLAFLAGDAPWEPADATCAPVFVRIEFSRPSYAERILLWEAALDSGTARAANVDLGALAGKFRFSGGQIRDAATTARNLARWRDPQAGLVTMDDLAAACRLQSNRKLAELAHKITPHYTWDDIILPADRLQLLRDVCNYIAYHALVYDEWGFDRKLAMGKGLNVLFAGPSGTGKTMAADVMAGELGLDLYKIDLSTVVSKYIGETEKNLARIFAEAETSNAILFFDEADALFGKRSEVKDAHDRYANVEISYLLQKMEEYDGVVILATNLRKNMDEAFVRRMHFTVEFPFPGEQDRRRIWQQIWPERTPRGPDLDLGFMARRFEIAGGNIRNVALAAAFLAAADGGAVTMAHLIQATQREYQKIGKLVVER